MMNRVSSRIALGAIFLIAASCTADRRTPTDVLRVPVFDRGSSMADMSDDHARHLETDLKGGNEVPPHVTPASGEAQFRVSEDGKSVSYKLFVDDILNPFMAHIHIAAAGMNGPIVEWLFPSTAPVPGPFGVGLREGLIAEGTFTAANLVGPLKGHPLSELLDAIRAGNAYVNVHTSDGKGVNTGPGNFPGGEIRGQLGAKNDGEADDEHKDEQNDDKRVVKMLDDCDPASFNAAVGAGTCAGNGRTTFQSFIAELGATGIAKAWRFDPFELEAAPGTTLLAKNRGGEVHTFTRVASFGGGRVASLNALSHNPVEAAECKNLAPDDFVAPGGKYKETVSREEVQRFQCCIHPWMRTTVSTGDDKGDHHGG